MAQHTFIRKVKCVLCTNKTFLNPNAHAIHCSRYHKTLFFDLDVTNETLPPNACLSSLVTGGENCPSNSDSLNQIIPVVVDDPIRSNIDTETGANGPNTNNESCSNLEMKISNETDA